MSDKIAILYGPMGGSTEKVAKLIVDKIGEDKCELIPVELADGSTINQYSKFIIGGATIGTHTWSDESTNTGWNNFLPKLRKADFQNKKVAVFGLGDQVAYTDHFVDDLKLIYDAVTDGKGTIVGQWPIDGYDFNESEAIIDGKFIGLAIDEDSQAELTEQRIDKWVNSLLSQF